jgi:hypothetical protein
MEEPHTNLAEVAADRVTLWSAERLEHCDIRELFVDSEAVTRPVRILQQVGEESQPSNEQVPALADLLSYIEQERLGAGTTVNKYYTINRTNTALIQPEITISRRGRTGGRGARGPAGKGQVVVQEGDVYVRMRESPRGRRGPRARAPRQGGAGGAGLREIPASAGRRESRECLARLGRGESRECLARECPARRGHRESRECLASAGCQERRATWRRAGAGAAGRD